MILKPLIDGVNVLSSHRNELHPFLYIYIYCSSVIEPLNIQNDQHVNKYAVL